MFQLDGRPRKRKGFDGYVLGWVRIDVDIRLRDTRIKYPRLELVLLCNGITYATTEVATIFTHMWDEGGCSSEPPPNTVANPCFFYNLFMVYRGHVVIHRDACVFSS